MQPNNQTVRLVHVGEIKKARVPEVEEDVVMALDGMSKHKMADNRTKQRNDNLEECVREVLVLV